MFLLSPRNICVSFPANFVACYKFSKMVKLGDIEGTCHARQCCLRPVSLFSQALTQRLSQKLQLYQYKFNAAQHSYVQIYTKKDEIESILSCFLLSFQQDYSLIQETASLFAYSAFRALQHCFQPPPAPEASSASISGQQLALAARRLVGYWVSAGEVAVDCPWLM